MDHYEPKLSKLEVEIINHNQGRETVGGLMALGQTNEVYGTRDAPFQNVDKEAFLEQIKQEGSSIRKA